MVPLELIGAMCSPTVGGEGGGGVSQKLTQDDKGPGKFLKRMNS